MFCVAVLLTSCGAARKAAEKENEEAVPPQTWRETMQQDSQATLSQSNVAEVTDTTLTSK